VGQWIAAGFATAGVVVMGVTDFKPGGKTGVTTALALGCAAAFALTDVTIQSWSGPFGVFNFLALQFAALGLLSASLLPFFGWKSLRVPTKAWKWIFAAAVFSALQAFIVTATIAVWRDAAGVNVVYATRGLWSVALVWFIGHRIGNTERHTAGHRRMGLRLAGATLIVAAVVLTVRFGAR
jgi:drug/metabolite transporter (DMT)-like permease